MKKLLLLASLLFTVQLTFGQCTPDGSITTPGIISSPNNIDCITQGVPFTDTVQFMNFDSIYFNNQWVPLVGLIIDSVNNLPCGINWELNKPSNQYDPSEQGCILISGVTNDSVGQYQLEIWANVNIGTGYFGPILANNFDLLEFFVRVKSPSGICPVIDTTAFNHKSDCGIHFGLPVEAVSEDDSICVWTSTALSVNAPLGSGHYGYSWSPATGLSCTDCAEPEFNAGTSGTHEIYVTIYDSISTLSSTDTVYVVADYCDGIDENNRYARLNVYPNPSEGKYFIEPSFSSSNTFDLSLRSIQGQEVMSKNYSNEGSRLELDIRDMPAGIYFIYLTDGKAEFMNKIVKQ